MKVLFPISVPEENFCWDRGVLLCDHFDNEGGIPICKLNVGDIKSSQGGRAIKPNPCKILEKQKVETIFGFKGDYAFLSNFFISPVMFEGLKFRTSEHAFQAAKTLDPQERMRILNASSPGRAKRIGRSIKLREDWDDIKLRIMEEIVRDKFYRSKRLTRYLIKTKKLYLVETNHWNDTFWGVCDGVGKNYLGKILMIVRNDL